ncbi:unnamed protein product [Boreogadus saida]
MTSPDSPPLAFPSLPPSPTPSSPPGPSSQLPQQPSLPPTGEVMVLALGRRKQRVLIALSILPNLFLAFLLSSDPLLTLAPPHHCHLAGPLVVNVSVPWERGGRPGEEGRPSRCQQYVNGSPPAVDCTAGWDYNVTEGLQHNIVTEARVLAPGLLEGHAQPSPDNGSPGDHHATERRAGTARPQSSCRPAGCGHGHAVVALGNGGGGGVDEEEAAEWVRRLLRGPAPSHDDRHGAHPIPGEEMRWQRSADPPERVLLACCRQSRASMERQGGAGVVCPDFTLSPQPAWDLVCGQYWLVPVEEVCFILGMLTGCLGLGFAADRLGRSKALLTSLTLSVVFGVLVCVAPYPSVFIAMRFALAAASAGVYLTLYLTRLELCEPSRRLLVTVLAGLLSVAGELLLLAVALGFQSWRGLLGAGAAPLTLFLCYGVPGVFPESPRWLLLAGRSEDTSSFSGRRGSSRESRDDESFTELDLEPSGCSRPRLSYHELFHSRNIWKNICILGFTSFISHGISHCYSSFRGDVRGDAPSFYWTYLLSVCAGGGAWLLLWATVDRCGRRGILLLSMTMTGLASLILLGLMDYLSETAITVFSVLGLFSSQATASLCIFFTAEIMPTVIRGTGVGVVLALGCVGRLSSPLMDLRNHYGYFLHHVVYSSLALLAVLSILLLPESKRKTLPQTLADGEQYRRPPLGRRRRDNVPLLVTPNPET